MEKRKLKGGPVVALISRWRFVATLEASEVAAVIWSSLAGLGIARIRDGLAGPDVLGCLAVSVIVSIEVCFVFRALGAYRFELILHRLRSTTMAIFAWSVAAGSLVLLATVHDPKGGYARAWVAAWFVTGLGSIVVLRLLAAVSGAHLRKAGKLGHNVCIVGAGEEVRSCAAQASRDRGGVTLLGYFKSGSDAIDERIDLRCLGALADIPAFIRCHRVDEIIVATSPREKANLAALILELRCLPVRLALTPGSVGMAPGWLAGGEARIGDLPLLQAGATPLEGWRWVLKDAQDRLLALLALVIFAPVLLAIAIAIRIASPGPVFFRQTREGYGGREFRIFKFRTMHATDAAQEANRLRLAVRHDPRVFPLGAFLRRTSLDELPQLFNVLLGDMWFIGPRPHSPLATAADARYADVVRQYSSRHRIKPGITGWAQVNGWRGPTETAEQIEQRVMHDLYYIENWSMLLDLQILMKTGLRGFVHQNAF